MESTTLPVLHCATCSRPRNDLTIPGDLDYGSWSLDFFVDYMQYVYHAALYRAIPGLRQDFLRYRKLNIGLAKEVTAAIRVVEKLEALVLDRNLIEEKSTFPYIRQLYSAFKLRLGLVTISSCHSGSGLTITDNTDILVPALTEELEKISSFFMSWGKSCSELLWLAETTKNTSRLIRNHQRIERDYLFPRARKLEKLLIDF